MKVKCINSDMQFSISNRQLQHVYSNPGQRGVYELKWVINQYYGARWPERWSHDDNNEKNIATLKD